ncbi:MAG TPA: ice-binding family protein [Candidatus Paceibacterota bacterium]
MLNKKISGIRGVSAALLFVTVLTTGVAHAATSPSLGLAETFGILSGTYTNTVVGTTISGDLGYTTGPAVAPTVINGGTHSADVTYSGAGSDQGVALAALGGEPCTFTFPNGAVDLASNAQFPTATYGPGVYCATGAMAVGTGGITLQGAGTYIFRTTGALNTAANSAITLANGASECDVWWTPIGATTLGANSTFEGTVIDNAGITIGSMVTWTGRALAFGGTVTTDDDTITVSSCAAAAPSASLTVTKAVVNDDDGTLAVSDFPLFVNGVPVMSGMATTTLTPGTYAVSETGDAGYVAGDWGGDCAADGSITLADGDVKTCTITNDDVDAVVSSGGGNGGGGGSSRRRRPDPVASSTDTTSESAATTSPVVVSGATPLAATSPGTNSSIPKLPNAGLSPDSNLLAIFAAALGAFGGMLAIAVLRRKKASASVDAI